MGLEQRRALIQEIERKRESRVICCLTSDRPNANGLIAKDFIPIFYDHLNSFPDAKNVDVFLFTLGGDTLASFGLSRLIREFAKRIGLLVPDKCHSGGTLFALGADQIFMSKMATLSPIDPSISGPLNPVVEVAPGVRQPLPVSVESVAGFKALVKQDWELNDEAIGAAFKLLADKVNPLLLGDVYRSRQQIAKLAEKLLLNHRKNDQQIEKIIGKLTKDLGSHDYLISKSEARSILGARVVQEDPDLDKLIMALYKDFTTEMELGKAYDPAIALHAAKATGAKLPVPTTQKIVMIESTSSCDVWERELLVSSIQAMTPMGPQESIRQDIIKNGWKRYNIAEVAP